MLRDDAVSIIKGRLARWNDTVLANYIIVELKAAQQRNELMEPLPWFLLTESSYTVTVEDEERIEIPADFIREADEDAFWVEDASGNWTKLIKDDYDYIRGRFTGTGIPERYALVGRYLRVRPAPDGVYNVHMIYYGKDEALSTNIENKWLANAPEVLIADAGHVIASRYVRNDSAAAEFKQDFMRARKELLVANQARLDANRIYRSDN